MDSKDPPEFILDVFTDPRSVRDVVKAILHTIFFTRFFPSLHPRTRDVLDLTLPYVDDAELETMIEQRAAALERQLDSLTNSSSAGATTTSPAATNNNNNNTGNNTRPYSNMTNTATATATTTTSAAANGARGQVAVQFFEKRRRKAWLSRGDEEVCWECWTVKVTVAEPRTESGTFISTKTTCPLFLCPSQKKKKKKKKKGQNKN
jgi:hypothetical protein